MFRVILRERHVAEVSSNRPQAVFSKIYLCMHMYVQVLLQETSRSTLSVQRTRYGTIVYRVRVLSGKKRFICFGMMLLVVAVILVRFFLRLSGFRSEAANVTVSKKIGRKNDRIGKRTIGTPRRSNTSR